MKIILYLLVSVLLYAQEYPSFSAKELQNIQKNNSIAAHRVLDYQKYIHSCRNNSKQKQLNKINFYLNTLLPQYDDIINKEEDHWATPKEFLKIGYGDCEDYVIIKYYSLLKLGFDKKLLFITIVREQFYGGYHMVLTYFKDKTQPPLVLDNLSFKILNLQKRSDLKAELFINTTGVFKITKDFNLQKVAQRYKEFEELKTKVKNNY